MKIGLIDVDGHNFPNLALMRISAWHKAKGDVVVGHGLSYYGGLLGCIEDAPTIIPAEGG